MYGIFRHEDRPEEPWIKQTHTQARIEISIHTVVTAYINGRNAELTAPGIVRAASADSLLVALNEFRECFDEQMGDYLDDEDEDEDTPVEDASLIQHVIDKLNEDDVEETESGTERQGPERDEDDEEMQLPAARFIQLPEVNNDDQE